MANARRSIFIVDDEPLISMMIENAVVELGWEIEGSVHTEADAFRLLALCQPTVAVLDVKLGPTTSLGVAAVCRERGIPVLFITGYSAGDAIDFLGDAPVLCKPFSPEEFARSLQRCLTAPSGARCSD